MSLYQPSRGCCNQPPWELLTMFQINSAQVFIDITTLLQCTKFLLIPLSAAISCMMAQTEVRHSGRAHQLHLNRHLPLALSASSQRLWKNTKYKTQITKHKIKKQIEKVQIAQSCEVPPAPALDSVWSAIEPFSQLSYQRKTSAHCARICDLYF